jgi:hypothetical protein
MVGTGKGGILDDRPLSVKGLARKIFGWVWAGILARTKPMSGTSQESMRTWVSPNTVHLRRFLTIRLRYQHEKRGSETTERAK